MDRLRLKGWHCGLDELAEHSSRRMKDMGKSADEEWRNRIEWRHLFLYD